MPGENYNSSTENLLKISFSIQEAAAKWVYLIRVLCLFILHNILYFFIK